MREINQKIFNVPKQGNISDAGIHAEGDTTAGKKSIQVSATKGHQEIIEFLLSKGVSFDDRTRDDWTPLRYVAADL